MPFVPLRSVFRSRWTAVAWAAGICWSAVELVGPADTPTVNAAAASDGKAAQASALAAEDTE